MSYEHGSVPEGAREWKAPIDQPEKKESAENELKKNDLQTSENYSDRAESILKAHEIPFEMIQKTKREEAGKGQVPAQFIFRISDPHRRSEPASTEYMRFVYAALKDNEPDMPIAFGDPSLRQVARHQ